MLNKLRQLFNLKNRFGKGEPPDEETTAHSLGQKTQEKVNALKPKIELSAVIVDRNRWALTTLILSAALLVNGLGWYHATERLANHVRVAFVKLDPSGTHNVSFYDENTKPTFFMNTIYSLLTQYTERRYSQIPYMIKEDYGYVLNFMSPALQNAFVNDYKAAKIASDVETCKTCLQTKVTVRAVQNEESDQVILNGKPKSVYRSTVFARFVSLNPDGSYSNSVNEIITLTWTMKEVATLTNNLEMVRANPIGIEILAESIKEDPTPVTDKQPSGVPV